MESLEVFLASLARVCVINFRFLVKVMFFFFFPLPPDWLNSVVSCQDLIYPDANFYLNAMNFPGDVYEKDWIFVLFCFVLFVCFCYSEAIKLLRKWKWMQDKILVYAQCFLGNALKNKVSIFCVIHIHYTYILPHIMLHNPKIWHFAIESST